MASQQTEREKRLYVTCRDADRVVAIDAREFKELESLDVGSAPLAVAFCDTQAGERLVVANSLSDNISVLALSPLRELARPQAGRETVFGRHCGGRFCGLYRQPSGGSRQSLGGRQFGIDSGGSRPRSDFISRFIRIRPSGRGRRHGAGTGLGAHYPLIKVRNLVPITQVASGWVMSSGIGISDPKGGIIQMPLDEANDYFADPSGIAVDASGNRAYIASGGSDVVSVIDLDRLAGWLDKADATMKREAIEDLSLSRNMSLPASPQGATRATSR